MECILPFKWDVKTIFHASFPCVAAGRLISPTSVRSSAMEDAMENYLLERRMTAKIRNNGRRAFGHRSMMTIKMNARDAAEWRIKLIILT